MSSAWQCLVNLSVGDDRGVDVALRSVELRYVSSVGDVVDTSFDEVAAQDVVGGCPVRHFPSYAGMGHYPGVVWTATTGDFVAYESLLERDRVWLADFDPAVTGIASQPFRICGRDGSTTRTHVPDYLLRCADEVVVVDVKPAGLLGHPRVSAVLDWTGRLVARKGWRYEVWSGADAGFLSNVRFLAGARRMDLVDRELMSVLAAKSYPGDTIARVEERVCNAPRHAVRAASLSLLWHHVWEADLDAPLSSATIIRDVGTCHG